MRMGSDRVRYGWCMGVKWMLTYLLEGHWSEWVVRRSASAVVNQGEKPVMRASKTIKDGDQ